MAISLENKLGFALRPLVCFLIAVFCPAGELAAEQPVDAAFRRVKVCDNLDYEMLVPVGTWKPGETKIETDDGCGKMYLYTDNSNARVFGFGTIFYRNRINESDYERYRYWLSEKMTLEGADRNGTTFSDVGAVADRHLSRRRIVSKLHGSSDVRAWSVYDIGLANLHNGTVAIFYFIPYIVQGNALYSFKNKEAMRPLPWGL